MKITREKNQLILYEKSKIVFINLSEILYVEKIEHLSYVHTPDRKISVQISLKEMQNILPTDFIRSHRSYIINKNKILEINLINSQCYEVTYKNGKKALLKKNKVNEIFPKG